MKNYLVICFALLLCSCSYIPVKHEPDQLVPIQHQVNDSVGLKYKTGLPVIKRVIPTNRVPAIAVTNLSLTVTPRYRNIIISNSASLLGPWTYYCKLSTNLLVMTNINKTPVQFFKGVIYTAELELIWLPTQGTITGYKIYVGEKSGVYTRSWLTGLVTNYVITITNVAPTQYFALTSVSNKFESSYTEIKWVAPTFRLNLKK